MGARHTARMAPFRKKRTAPAKPAMIDAASYYKMHSPDLYIELHNGDRFYIDRPEFDIEVIGYALAKQCRFTGHVQRFYSVAEHSVLVMKLMMDLNLGDPREGLLHDATEAYLSDIAAPWKVLLPDYKKLEAKLDAPMRAHFNLPPTMTAGCKEADWLALFIEAYALMPSKAADWVAPPGIKERALELRKNIARYPIAGWYDIPAEKLFMEAYRNVFFVP